jgi:hypothetical protein
MTTTRWPEAAWHYQDETLRHELTVMHDDGNYRNLMFRNPASSFYWFSLATWPGHLAFTGDVGSWLFRRATDMFGFFTGSSHGDINPGYWGEKVIAGEVYERPEYRLDPDDEYEFKFHFLWACFAVRDGVNRYQRLKDPKLSPLPRFTVPVPKGASPTVVQMPQTVQPLPEYL